jgi:hypothetical protein
MNITQHIVVAMKPLDGNYSENAKKHGVAGLNIDEARVGFQPGEREAMYRPMTENKSVGWKNTSKAMGYNTPDGLPPAKGRFPANVVLGHLPGCKCLGTKQIAGDKATGLTPTKARSWKNASVAGINRTGYAGADGKETVEEWECEESCPVRIIGQQSGHGVSRKGKPRKGNNSNPLTFNHSQDVQVGVEYDDAGTAARFFKQVREE